MDHIQLAPDIDTHPGLERAGWAAARVFELLLKVCGLKDLRGRMSAEYRDPAYLARRWNLSPCDVPCHSPEQYIADALASLLALPPKWAVVAMDGDDLIIIGWEKFYKSAKSGAERTREWRERRAERDAGDARDVGCDGARHGDATPPTPPTHTTPPTPPPPSPSPDVQAAVVADKDFVDGLWKAIQGVRVELGAPPETTWPKAFANWCATAAMATPAGWTTAQAVALAVERYLLDRTIKATNHPTHVFIRPGVWDSRLPSPRAPAPPPQRLPDAMEAIIRDLDPSDSLARAQLERLAGEGYPSAKARLQEATRG